MKLSQLYRGDTFTVPRFNTSYVFQKLHLHPDFNIVLKSRSEHTTEIKQFLYMDVEDCGVFATNEDYEVILVSRKI